MQLDLMKRREFITLLGGAGVALCRDPQGERQDYAMRLATITFNRAILGARRIASALLLIGLFCATLVLKRRFRIQNE
jgi:hypothetical protein